jgi:hypothetical protein
MAGTSDNGSKDTGERDDVVVRKAEHGWVVGEENVSDLTSAMVLADLFAADQAVSHDTTALQGVDEDGAPRRSASPPAPRPNPTGQLSSGGATPRTPRGMPDGKASISGMQPVVRTLNDPHDPGEAQRLAVTVSQLEYALASRVRVEQAIGVLAERHRMRPREAFDLLRGAARSRGQRVTEMAQDVVASAANPLLQLPDELARKLAEPRPRGRSLRRGRHAAER